MADHAPHADVLGLTAQIVAAHVANHSVAVESLPALIQDVYRTLSSIGKASAGAERPQPAVPIRKSVFADHIICLEDGKPLKMLKRHLKSAYNMTPEQYRERWGLGPDYPMVAPEYAQRRAVLARQIGLGGKAHEAK